MFLTELTRKLWQKQASTVLMLNCPVKHCTLSNERVIKSTFVDVLNKHIVYVVKEIDLDATASYYAVVYYR